MRKLLVVGALAALLGAPVAYALLREKPVVHSTRNEFTSGAGTHASGHELIVFARSRPGQPQVYDAYLRRISATRTTTVKLNTRGRGYGGGIDSPVVAYQQAQGDRSDVKLYDVDSRTRSNPPAGVNTSRWEYRPTISGDWLQFGRADVAGSVDRVVLFNTSTSEQRVIATTTRRAHALYPGQVAGNWVAYARCAPRCNVFRYNIASRTKTVVKKPDRRGAREQYAASVTASGVVYLVRSGDSCGSFVRIVRFFGASDPAAGTVIAALPTGRDVLFSSARSNADGSTDVFYDRGRCVARGYFDVYKVTDPPPSP